VIRIFQLDGDQAFRDEVAAYFSRLAEFSYLGLESLEELDRALAGETPQVILLDLHCAPQGGLAVLQKLRGMLTPGKTKVLIMSTQAPGERLLAQAAQLGADYFLLRPVDLVVLEKRIRQLVQNPTDPASFRELSFKQVQDICGSCFERLGIPPHYKGYRYLLVGIWLAALHPEWLNAVVRHLYPAIAQYCGVSAAQVERAMRYAIEAAWEKGDVAELYRLFPYVAENKGKPTNSQFISTMVHLVGLAAGSQG